MRSWQPPTECTDRRSAHGWSTAPRWSTAQLDGALRNCLATIGVLAAVLQPYTAVSAPIPREPTIDAVTRGLAAHAYTVQQLQRHYQERIEQIDRSGPALHAVIEVNLDAPRIARELDAQGASGRPLFGIPVLIKDNVDTADRMLTTAGSLALTGSRPAHDAFIVQRLRAAGAVILGKTNLSEWANFRSSHSSSGWSGRGGQTLNPTR